MKHEHERGEYVIVDGERLRVVEWCNAFSVKLEARDGTIVLNRVRKATDEEVKRLGLDERIRLRTHKRWKDSSTSTLAAFFPKGWSVSDGTDGELYIRNPSGVVLVVSRDGYSPRALYRVLDESMAHAPDAFWGKGEEVE